MTTKKLSCPECGKKFDFAKGMASHRLKMHGVAGSSEATINLRKQKAALAKLPPAVPVIQIWKCPECGEVFKDKRDLGLHKHQKHGIHGDAPSSVRAQKIREAYLSHYRRDKHGLCICPECDQAYKGAGITNHRKTAHGISSEEQARMFQKQAQTEPPKIETVAETPTNPNQCPQCGFVAQNGHGLHKHMSMHSLSNTPIAIYKREKRKHPSAQPTQAIAIAQSNGHITHADEAHTAPSGSSIPDAALALALGRFQGLCGSLAYELDLPARVLTERVAEFVYTATLRKSSRGAVRLS